MASDSSTASTSKMPEQSQQGGQVAKGLPSPPPLFSQDRRAHATATDIFAGTVAGFAQVLTGQPFDIVKVRLQSSSVYSGMLDCGTRIFREEGPLAFYKGTLGPLVGIGACVSLQFAFLQAGKRHFVTQNGGKKDPTVLSAPQLFLAGAGAGIGNSVASGPVEHIRIRLQTQTTALYSGPFDAVKKIYATDGIRGVYQGQVATLFREGLGYGFYFAAYELLVQREMEKKGIGRKEIPMTSAIGYGALAGWAMWLTNYPIDVIKSNMQTDGFPSQVAGAQPKKYNGTLDCARKIWAAQGWRGFTRGLTPTLIRSPFVNGATFAVFELVMKALN